MMSLLLSPTANGLDEGDWRTCDSSPPSNLVPISGSTGSGSAVGRSPLEKNPVVATCQCLSRAVTFLERLVSRSTADDNQIESLLAELRNHMETLSSLIGCRLCGDRAESNMLLAMAARQMGMLCNKTAKCYQNVRTQANRRSSSPSDGAESTTTSIEITVGTYTANQREGIYLLRTLVALQIEEFGVHIGAIKARYRTSINPGQVEVLREVEGHIKIARQIISTKHR